MEEVSTPNPVLVDAVGVTESDKTDSRSVQRKPTVPFDSVYSFKRSTSRFTNPMILSVAA